MHQPLGHPWVCGIRTDSDYTAALTDVCRVSSKSLLAAPCSSVWLSVVDWARSMTETDLGLSGGPRGLPTAPSALHSLSPDLPRSLFNLQWLMSSLGNFKKHLKSHLFCINFTCTSWHFWCEALSRQLVLLAVLHKEQNVQSKAKLTISLVYLPHATKSNIEGTRGQRHLAKAAPNDPTHTARGVHCMRRRWFKPRDRQTPWTSITIVRISCIRCSLKSTASWSPNQIKPNSTIHSNLFTKSAYNKILPLYLYPYILQTDPLHKQTFPVS